MSAQFWLNLQSHHDLEVVENNWARRCNAKSGNGAGPDSGPPCRDDRQHTAVSWGQKNLPSRHACIHPPVKSERNIPAHARHEAEFAPGRFIPVFKLAMAFDGEGVFSGRFILVGISAAHFAVTAKIVRERLMIRTAPGRFSTGDAADLVDEGDALAAGARVIILGADLGAFFAPRHRADFRSSIINLISFGQVEVRPFTRLRARPVNRVATSSRDGSGTVEQTGSDARLLGRIPFASVMPVRSCAS